MKKNIFGILLVGLAFTACDDDYTTWYQDEVPEAEANAPVEPLQNPKIEPFVSSVIVSWDKPANPQYYYTLLSWVDGKGQLQNRKISKYSVDPENPGRVRAIVGGFTDTNEYEFTLVACSYAGVQSAPVTAKAAPQSSEMAKDYVLSTVTVANDVESAIVSWKNEINVPVTLQVDYIDKYGDAQTATYDATLPMSETIKNLPIEVLDKDKAERGTLTIKAIDPESKAETDPVVFDVNPLKTKWDTADPSWLYIGRELWSNPDPTNMCTITYNNDDKTEFTVVSTGGDPYFWWKNTTPLGTKFVMRYKASQATDFQIFLSFPPSAAIAPTTTLKKTDYWETLEWDLTGKFGEWAGGMIYPRFDWGSQSGVTIHVRNAHFE